MGVNRIYSFKEGVENAIQIISSIVLATILVPITGCGSNQIEVISADNGKNLNFKVGEQIMVALEGNPSTGYIWEAKDLDASMIQRVGETEFKSSNCKR